MKVVKKKLTKKKGAAAPKARKTRKNNIPKYNKGGGIPSKKEQAYIVAHNKKADKERAYKNDIKDGITASRYLKEKWMDRTDENFKRAKAKATKDRLASYGFPKSVSDK
jgi:hypothetical protein